MYLVLQYSKYALKYPGSTDGGLKDYCIPETQAFEDLILPLLVLFGEARSKGLARGSMSLQVGFESM